jgi:hypothetical protein
LVTAGRHATVRRPIAEKHLQLISPNSPLVNRQSCDLILFVLLPQMGCAAACTAADIQLTFDRRSAAQIPRLDSGVNARGVGTGSTRFRVARSLISGSPAVMACPRFAKTISQWLVESIPLKLIRWADKIGHRGPHLEDEDGHSHASPVAVLRDADLRSAPQERLMDDIDMTRTSEMLAVPSG